MSKAVFLRKPMPMEILHLFYLTGFLLKHVGTLWFNTIPIVYKLPLNPQIVELILTLDSITKQTRIKIKLDRHYNHSHVYLFVETYFVPTKYSIDGIHYIVAAQLASNQRYSLKACLYRTRKVFVTDQVFFKYIFFLLALRDKYS